MRSNKGKVPPRYRHRVDENRSLWYRWHHIKRRCFDARCPRYKEYGGRGITMCKEWAESFDNFVDWALTSGYEENLTIERIDVNGNYCPDNCKWITRREQSYNKQDTIWVDYHGEHIQLRKLCKRLSKPYDTIHNRIMVLGWDVEKAIDEPSQQVDSLMSECKKRGLNYETVLSRINKLGWSREEALSVPLAKRGQKPNRIAK